MGATVYLETSVIGYLAMRPSSDIRTLSNQQITKEWWNLHRSRYQLFISQFVVNECLAGDPVAAAERASYYTGITMLEPTAAVATLAHAVQQALALPARATTDALHISIAAIHGVEYLLTWNCKHIANPAHRIRIENVCRDLGYEPPVICTPLDFLEIDDEF